MIRMLLLTAVAIAPLAFAGTAGAQAVENFTATLTGDQQTTPVDTDTTGRFRLLWDEFEGTATYTLAVRSGVRLFMAHVHCAPAGENGPIALWLAGRHDPGWDVDGKWISNATLTDANVSAGTACGDTLAEVIEAMRAGNTYVNVHSQANPSGEIRGQIGGTASRGHGRR
jgi:hypothetical protein